jgi:acyl dehydratase
LVIVLQARKLRCPKAQRHDEDDIAAFVDAIGDSNPVHTDRAYAATTPFKAPSAPGIFTAGLISAVIGPVCPVPARSICRRP